MQVTWKMRRLYHKAQYDYSTSQPLTMRTLAKSLHARWHTRAMFSMVTGGMNKPTRGRKALPSVTRGSMIMPMVEGLARLRTRSGPLFATWKSTGCSSSWTLLQTRVVFVGSIGPIHKVQHYHWSKVCSWHSQD